jgi:hypothetical protein
MFLRKGMEKEKNQSGATSSNGVAKLGTKLDLFSTQLHHVENRDASKNGSVRRVIRCRRKINFRG